MFNHLYQKYFVKPVTNIFRNELAGHRKKISYEIEDLKIQVGRSLSMLNHSKDIQHIHEAEFKVFSQWGDDGIIQFLINKLEIKNKIFIEFGVQNYTESNTRFLLINNNWKGLIIDSSEEFMNYVKKDSVYWKYDLTVECSFITAENINSLFSKNKFSGDIGILSIDIDGNDYWVWEKINSVSPDIVITEYNSLFGCKYPVTIPYEPAFTRQKAHYSHLYWGTSLKALYSLALKKGYVFIGCNSNGNNAYFIKKEKANGLKALSAEEGYVESNFRESHDKNGNLNFLSGKDRSEVIKEMQVYDVEKNSLIALKDIL